MYLTVIKQNEAKQNEAMSLYDHYRRAKRYKGYFTNEQKVHQLINSFVKGNRKSENLLYFKPYQDCSSFCIQSNTVLDIGAVERNGYHVVQATNRTAFYNSLQNGMIVKFSAKLAPTRTQGKRKISIGNAEERYEWVIRKFQENGGDVKDMYETPGPRINWYHRYDKKDHGSLYGHVYVGYVEITDAEKFVRCLKEGIGRGKAYGCGLVFVESL